METSLALKRKVSANWRKFLSHLAEASSYRFSVLSDGLENL